jgi:hypothetical protein
MANKKEIFKRIELGGRKFYEISNLGTVRTINRTVFRHNARGASPVKYKGKVISQSIDSNNGCYKISVNDEDYKSYAYLVHVLVAKTFVPNPKKYERICFKDGDKLNPKASNLKWIYHPLAKAVVNKKTKEKFNSVVEAHVSIPSENRMTRHTFRCKLSGEIPNDTPFRYI